jgi:hypothetical protein
VITEIFAGHQFSLEIGFNYVPGRLVRIHSHQGLDTVVSENFLGPAPHSPGDYQVHPFPLQPTGKDSRLVGRGIQETLPENPALFPVYFKHGKNFAMTEMGTETPLISGYGYFHD